MNERFPTAAFDSDKSVPVTLDTVPPGTTVIIHSLRESNSPVFHRLISMGLVSGQTLTITRAAPFGDPIAVTVLGYTLSLRLAEAKILNVIPAHTPAAGGR